ncbi:MFS transporter [Saliphagus infecundisoli]|uniref:MFS transporter n=1 Tax=Saliphagus infecundisoli TaxID=1849069 RepID=A0ABD5QG66_9EURY|nr:MFS transporter [Saliphagus infecundisoli]
MGSTTAARLRGLGRFDALVLTALIWFLAKFLRYAFPPLFEPLQASYSVSNTAVGAAFTAFMVVYALLQFPSGLLADRLGSVTVIVGGALLAAAGAFGVALEPPFLALVAAMVVIGAGTGAHKTVAIRLLSRAYPARTGRALGVLDTIGTFGGVAAPAAVVAVASVPLLSPGWRTLFLAAGVTGVALAAAFLRRVPERLPDAGAAGGSDGGVALRQYLAVFAAPRFAAFVVATLAFSFAYNGAVAFVPLYLSQEAGLSSAAASGLYSLLFALSLVQLATGEVGDRVGTLPVIFAALGVATVGLVSLVALTPTGNLLALGAAVVAFGIGSHGFRPVRGSFLISSFPDSIAGGSLGVVRTLLMAAGAISPVTVGYLSETVGFRPAFWLLAGSVAVATAICAALLAIGDRS